MAEAVGLDRSFFAPSAVEVAPRLLNKVVQVGPRAGRIVEVEAYEGPDDPGSHGHRGPTPRTEVMFGPPGHLYVYFTYGMHWCANVVCGAEGSCSAVLLRALEPLTGVDEMRRARGGRDRDLSNGPAKLCQALGVDGSFDGVDLSAPESPIRVVDDGAMPPAEPVQTTRVGLSAGVDLPWRWYVPGSPWVSRP